MNYLTQLKSVSDVLRTSKRAVPLSRSSVARNGIQPSTHATPASYSHSQVTTLGNKWRKPSLPPSSLRSYSATPTTPAKDATASAAMTDEDAAGKAQQVRREQLRKTLASFKSVTRAQGGQQMDASSTDTNGAAETLDTLAATAAGKGAAKAGSPPASPTGERNWTTRIEAPKTIEAKPVMTWGEWLQSPQAMKETMIEQYHHYKNGSKLLVFNVAATSQILKRKLQGQNLTRREYQLLVRTASDLFRLVPFSIFVIVPFLELTLPIFLKLFPNMLPSTFADKLQQKESIRKQLALKIETARFLQDTLVEMKADTSNAETKAFIEKLRSGEGVSTEDLVQYARVFNEDLTLNHLGRNQLTAMCRLLGVQPFGTDTFLIVQIRLKMGSLQKDDRAIMAEGVDSLTLEELQQAVLARGMYSNTKNKRVLRDRLKNWLDMSITRNVPITLLILSRAFALNARADLGQALKATFEHMPAEVIDEIDARVGNASQFGRRVDRKLKLEALEQFRALIEEERAAVASGATQGAQETPFAALATLTQPTELERLQIEELRTQVSRIKAEVNDEVKELQQHLAKMEEQLKLEQDEEYKKLVEQRSLWPTQTHETDEEFAARWKTKRNDVLAEELARQKERDAETKSVRQLENRVVNLLAELGVDVAEAKAQLEEEMKVLDKNYDGLISEDELKFALNTLSSKLTDEQIQVVIDRLDANHDGLIEVPHLFKVARELDIDLRTALAEARKKEEQIQAKTDSAANTSAPSTPSATPSSTSSSDTIAL